VIVVAQMMEPSTSIRSNSTGASRATNDTRTDHKAYDGYLLVDQELLTQFICNLRCECGGHISHKEHDGGTVKVYVCS
jgi:hypothetical protein